METKEIFSRRLKSAREMKSLSMEDLVSRMSNMVSKQAVSKYESGKMLPDSAVLIRLAEALDVKVDYFFRSYTVSLSGIEFRKKAKMSVKARKAIEQSVLDSVERYSEIEDICGLSNKSSLLHISPVIRTSEDIVRFADSLRKKWGLGEDGITDVIALLESKGVKVVEVYAPDDFDGLSGEAGGGIVIVLNANRPVERKRFTALHELGHLMMRFDNGVDNKEKENLCHLFASEVLIPRKSFVRIVGEVSKTALSMRTLADIQRSYGISIDALIRKAYDADMIAGNRYKAYYIHKNANHAFKDYVDKTRIEPESPRRFESLVLEAYARSIISISKASSLLNIPVHEVRDRAMFV